MIQAHALVQNKLSATPLKYRHFYKAVMKFFTTEDCGRIVTVKKEVNFTPSNDNNRLRNIIVNKVNDGGIWSDYKICKSPTDGHCFIYSVLTH